MGRDPIRADEGRNGFGGSGKGSRPAAPVTIRELRLDDLPAVYALGEQLFTPERWPALYRTWDPYEIANLYASDGDYCFVAEASEPDGDRVVGFVLGTLIHKRRSAWSYGYLIWIGVEPDQIKRGIGSRLVERLTEVFIEDGARMMLVDTDAENHDAIRFFHAEGFKNDTPHVYLERNLTKHPEYLRQRQEREGNGGRRNER